MEKIRNYTCQIFAALFVLVFALSSCNEQSSLGVEILPDGDLINIRSTIIKEDISSFTHRENGIPTDEASRSLLGSFSDSIFGNTTIDFGAQFRLFTFPDFGTNAKADSMQLYLYYRVIYGDTITPQNISVYELETALDIDASYDQDVDLKSMASTTLLGELEFTPRVFLDSIYSDTVYQVIKVPIDVSLAEKLLSADSLTMVNNDSFLEYFKGLYIESKKLTDQGGAVITLEAASSSSTGFQGSALVLFYSNDDIKTEAGGDSSLIMPYIITPFSARVNHIEHDYTGAPFYGNLDSETVQDSLIFVQSTGGLKSKINIDDLSSWGDSVNTAINKAELIFQIDTVASQVHQFTPPLQLLFTVLDEDGVEFLPIDYVFSPTFYGGQLRSDYTYHFNITQHVQQIIDGNSTNYGFYLTTSQKNNQANRVVLKGSTSTTGIKLLITYSKFTK